LRFGDSLVQGVGASPGNDLVSTLSTMLNNPIVNSGRSGDTTADGLARVSEVANNNPKLVIIILGGNDALKGMSPDETFSNLEKIVTEIHSSGAIVVLLGVRGGLFNDPYAKRFEDLSKKLHTAFVPDILSGLIGREQYMADTVHPNDVGYQKIAERVYPVVSKLLK
jgi:acyl-CoA thioesterase-1